MALKEQANVEPDFTTVVWQKLEQQNPSFFRAYNLQLQLKEQILVFNFLVRWLVIRSVPDCLWTHTHRLNRSNSSER